MWIKYFLITALLYLFAILQNTFFAHFRLMETTPNLVLAFFILLIFFEEKKINYKLFFYAILAGLLLDIFSSLYFGVSIIFLILIGFLIKKIQLLLSEKNGLYPFIYFISLFFISFIIYNLFLNIYFYFFGPEKGFLNISWSFLIEIIYNLFFALIIFWVYKKILGIKTFRNFRYQKT